MSHPDENGEPRSSLNLVPTQAGYTQFLEDTQLISNPTQAATDEGSSQTLNIQAELPSEQELDEKSQQRSTPFNNRTHVSDTYGSTGILIQEDIEEDNYIKDNSPNYSLSNPILKSFHAQSIGSYSQEEAPKNDRFENQDVSTKDNMTGSTQFVFGGDETQTPFFAKIRDPFQDTPESVKGLDWKNIDQSTQKLDAHEVFQKLRQDADKVEIDYDSQFGLVIEGHQSPSKSPFRNDTMRLEDTPFPILATQTDGSQILTQVPGTAEKAKLSLSPMKNMIVALEEDEINTDDDDDTNQKDSKPEDKDSTDKQEGVEYDDSIDVHKKTLKRKASEPDLVNNRKSSKTSSSYTSSSKFHSTPFRSRSLQSPKKHLQSSSPVYINESSPTIREAHILRSSMSSKVIRPDSSPTKSMSGSLNPSETDNDNSADDDYDSDYRDENDEGTTEEIEHDPIVEQSQEETSHVSRIRMRNKHRVISSQSSHDASQQGLVSATSPFATMEDAQVASPALTDEDQEEGIKVATEEDISTNTQIIEAEESDSPLSSLPESEMEHISSHMSFVKIDNNSNHHTFLARQETQVINDSDDNSDIIDDSDVANDIYNDPAHILSKELPKEKHVISSNLFPEGVKREDGPLTGDDMVFKESVWGLYGIKRYPGFIRNVFDNTATVEFFDAPVELRFSDIHPLDIRIGDKVSLINKKGSYIVTGLLCKIKVKSNYEDDVTIRCMRGYDHVLVRQIKKRNVFSDQEVEVSLSEILMSSSQWAEHKVTFEFLEGEVNTATNNSFLNVLEGTTQPGVAWGSSPHRGRSHYKLEMSTPDLNRTLDLLRSSPRKHLDFSPALAFSGSVFCLTQTPSTDRMPPMYEDRRLRLAKLITDNGGVVLHGGFDECLNMVKEDVGLRLKSEALVSFKFAAVISNSYCRSAKYIQTLALGWPVLSDCFITDCLEDGVSFENWPSYLLPAGDSQRLGAIKSMDVSIFRTKLNEQCPLSEQLTNNSSILSQYRIVVLGDKSQSQGIEPAVCEFIFHALGAKSCDIFRDYGKVLETVSSYPGVDKDYKILLYLNNRTCFQAYSHLSGSGERKSRRARKGAVTKNQPMYLIDWEWVVQCVISGFAWKPKYTWS